MATPRAVSAPRMFAALDRPVTRRRDERRAGFDVRHEVLWCVLHDPDGLVEPTDLDWKAHGPKLRARFDTLRETFLLFQPLVVRAIARGFPAEAAYWYQKAAEKGYALAQRNLGVMYMNGDGVEQNKPLAFAWHSILADTGNVMDVHRRDALQQQLTDAEIQEAMALKATLQK